VIDRRPAVHHAPPGAEPSSMPARRSSNTSRSRTRSADCASFVLATRLARAEHIREAADAALDAIQPRRTRGRTRALQRAAVLTYGHDGVCRFVGSRGLSEAYRAAVEGHCPWVQGTPDARSIVVQNVAKDPALAPYRELFKREKIGAMAFIPLATERGVVGKVMLYARKPGSITAAAVRTAEGAASLAGIALVRILAMRRLERSEARFRAMVEGTEIIVWEFDPHRRAFTYVSPQAAKLGFPLHEWSTPGFWEQRLHPDDRAAAVEFCACEVRAGRNHRFQYRMIRADGTVVWMDDFVTVDQTPGRPPLLRGVLVDITERKQAEKALIDAQERAELASRAKSEFLANMSHEIRTPLTSVLGYADMLREDGDASLAPQRRLEAIEIIKNAGQHLLTVINDILDLSKIEADRMTVESTPTNIGRVLLDVHTLLSQRAAARGIALSVNLTTPLPAQVMGDATRLRQILVNLAGNAVKFTRAGSVTINAGQRRTPAGDHLIIDVEDTGEGMTPQQAERIFAAFVQADARVTRVHGGTGLGLTISRRLARLMNGDVELVRTAPGRGSCFRLEVPLNAVAGCGVIDSLSHDSPQLPARADDAQSLRGRILLAEDGPDNQRIIAWHLRRAGAEVDIADNGRAALAMLDRPGARYDLLLTDIQMPEMDGYALAAELRRRGSTLATVALTAHAMAEDRRRCADAGCDGYASKPIDRADLLAVCAEWIGKPSRWAPRRSAA